MHPVSEPITSPASEHSSPNTAPVVSDSGSVEPRSRRLVRRGPRGRPVSAADSGAQRHWASRALGKQEGRGGRRGVPDPPPRTVFLLPLKIPTLPNWSKFTKIHWGRVKGEVACWLLVVPPPAQVGKRPPAGWARGVGARAPSEADRGVAVPAQLRRAAAPILPLPRPRPPPSFH